MSSKAKLAMVGLVVCAASLAIAKQAPEMIAEMIKKEVNAMTLLQRVNLACRIVLAKL